jgi:serine/threonine-protein kinase RsbW
MGATDVRSDDHGSTVPAAVQVPVHPVAIAAARRSIARAARQAGLGVDRIDDLVVAASEACTNALEAQARAGVQTPIEVTCRVLDGVFEVEIRDHGSGFQPDSIPPRPPLQDPGHLDVERGWGIQLMRALVDDVTYDFTGAGTGVLLRARLDVRD